MAARREKTPSLTLPPEREGDCIVMFLMFFRTLGVLVSVSKAKSILLYMLHLTECILSSWREPSTIQAGERGFPVVERTDSY